MREADGVVSGRRMLPPWAMGLAVAPMGFYYGFISTAMGILLAAKGVSVEQVSVVSFWGFLPTVWGFVLSPILDVGLSKRTYAVIFATIAAVCVAVSTLLTGNLTAFTVVLTVGCAAAVLFGNAHHGWMPDVIEDKHYSSVGGTSNIANLGAAGLYATLSVVLVRMLPPIAAAVCLGLVLLAPVAMLFYIPLPTRPVRSAREVFGTFFRDFWSVVRKRSSVLGLICFLSPAACFTLTNLFSTMGDDFHTSEKWVTAINGPLVAVVCSIGCVAGIWLCKRFVRRNVYVLAGFGGAAAALGMIWMPHTLAYYAVGVLVYNFFQGINYTAFSAFEFEIVGPGNPLAATQIAVLSGAANAPITYMTRVEGHFHSTHGLGGMLAVDAVSTVVMGVVLMGVFRWIGMRDERVRA